MAARKVKPAYQWQAPTLATLPRLAASHLRTPAAVAEVLAPKREVTLSGQPLEAVLERWRDTRSEEAAAELELLDQAHQKRLKGRSRGTVDAVWKGNAADVSATGWLAANIFTDPQLVDAPRFAFELDDDDPGFDELTGAPHTALNPAYAKTRFAAVFERFEALMKLLPDPRAAPPLTRFATKPSLGPINELELLEALAAALERSGDPRQVPALKNALAEPPWKRQGDRDFFARRLPGVIDALSKAGPPLPNTPLDPGTTVGDAATLDALFTHVLENRSDDAPRLVLADWLLERGDPRGEFISLQVNIAKARAPAAKDLQRATWLEKTHSAAWLGPVARTLRERKWSRGFLVSASLEQNAHAPPQTWASAYSHPSLELLEDLAFGWGNRRHFVGFLLGGRLLSLDAHQVSPDLIPALERAARSRSA